MNDVDKDSERVEEEVVGVIEFENNEKFVLLDGKDNNSIDFLTEKFIVIRKVSVSD